MQNKNNKKQNKSRQVARVVLIIIAILMIVFGAVYFGYYLYSNYVAEQEQTELTSVTQTTAPSEVSEDKTVSNPIDFAKLQKQNSEIYAWIKVPGTKVDYPICQSKSDDEFYLKHSATDKSWKSSGAVYTESCNTTTFNDRVTVIYGHNGYGQTMFTTLHRFESTDTFNKHEYFYIYTPDSKLTYQIISAFKYDDRHIMNSFDFQNDDVFEQFINMVKNPDSTNVHVRGDLDKVVTKDDKLVVLSTCITNQKSSRYLVCGVLVKNEKTD